MILTRTLMLAATALGLSAALASAEPAVIFDLGGKFDKSFNVLEIRLNIQFYNFFCLKYLFPLNQINLSQK